MADKDHSLILEALERATAHPGGIPLHGSRKDPGLFATSAPAKQAAQTSKAQGLLEVLRTMPRGHTVHEICTITDKGLDFLLSEINPQKILPNLLHRLQSNGSHDPSVVSSMQQCQASLAEAQKHIQTLFFSTRHVNGAATIRSRDTVTASPLPNGRGSVCSEILDYLRGWSGPEDCPLPKLYQHLKQSTPTLTIGQFHDPLRSLHHENKLYLHPWTGPLHEIPEPAVALLVGHAVVYYASAK